MRVSQIKRLLIFCNQIRRSGIARREADRYCKFCNHLLLKTRDGLGCLERLEYSSTSVVDSPDHSYSVQRDIFQIHTVCANMDRLWHSVVNKPQRVLRKRKVEQVVEEVDSLRDSLDTYFQRQRRMQ